jgi:hypothetical protein
MVKPSVIKAKTFFIVTAFVLISIGAHAVSLRTPLVEVNLGCVKLGRTYSLVEIRNLPLSVTNTGDFPVSLAIEVVTPRTDELRNGYKPIPDTNWIRVEQNFFLVAPGKSASTDVLVAVPGDKEHLGQHYQVWLWSHTVSNGGLGVGLKSRILFSICEE